MDQKIKEMADKELLEETRGLVEKWNTCVVNNDPKTWPPITESFGVMIVDGVRHEFKSRKEAEEFRKGYEVQKASEV